MERREFVRAAVAAGVGAGALGAEAQVEQTADSSTLLRNDK
jgi:hypothetical protein